MYTLSADIAPAISCYRSYNQLIPLCTAYRIIAVTRCCKRAATQTRTSSTALMGSNRSQVFNSAILRFTIATKILSLKTFENFRWLLPASDHFLLVALPITSNFLECIKFFCCSSFNSFLLSSRGSSTCELTCFPGSISSFLWHLLKEISGHTPKAIKIAVYRQSESRKRQYLEPLGRHSRNASSPSCLSAA